ncbi:phage integrase family protein [Oceanococcus atlanticus]|uniref:Phage integrase family protein n=1 Tax=Oceanococcus atlanticus TaxID=1317117 RepID=A0A1Y1S9N5_9GAMM|nr:phage integrase family protein [Oceanococcus atlanticus]
MSAEMTLGTFDYAKYFPNSPRASTFERIDQGRSADIPLFSEFAPKWIEANEPRWRIATQQTNRGTVTRHLLPAFGGKMLDQISKADVLDFRAALSKVPGRNGNATLSAKTINHTLSVLSMIMVEANDRYGCGNPVEGIKRLRQDRPDIEPFSLDEVMAIINGVRADYRNYFLVRFFTGMRTAEVHGLKWRFVDFERKQILVRESFHHGREEKLKTAGSMREVDMSTVVFDALTAQATRTRSSSPYVFCTRAGTPLDTKNVTDRVWYPLLNYLGLRRRRPYQCRHTAATLWLAAGENPEWIARQLGHVDTQMLFRVYSRYVPNLTRTDGSAFNQLLNARVGQPLNFHPKDDGGPNV